MRGPLSLRINDGVTDRHVTQYASGLQFRKSAVGGHADASVRLKVPNSMFDQLGPADRLYIYDARTAETVWEGYTNNPGTASGRDGQGLDLSALGGSALASDRRERLVYIDRSLESWAQDTEHPQAPSGTAQVSDGPDGSGVLEGTPGLYLQFNPGHPVDSGYQVGLIYNGLLDSPMKVGGLVGRYDAGINSPGLYRVDWFALPAAGTSYWDVLHLGVTDLELYAGGAYLDADQPMLAITMIYTGAATNVTTDTVWSLTGDVSVLGQLVDRYGADLNMATAAHVTVPDAYILAHEIVEDLLGRILTFCDPSTATLDVATYEIDQLSYADATSAADVLADLALYEPDMLWEILESDDNGLHRFNYRAWPTIHRYLIPPSMPIDVPGSDVDLCNRIAVNWADVKGKPQITIVGAYVPELGNKSPVLAGALDPTFVGRVRDADPVTLPEGRGSAANAVRIGTQILAEKADPPTAAKVTVDRPIMDVDQGRWVMPWEIEPGYLARVIATGEDLRLTEMEYDDDSCSSTLTLGDPALSMEQRLARLDRVEAK